MAPLALTGAGNVTSIESGSSSSLAGPKPANIATGDLLWAAAFFRNGAASLTPPAGWTTAKTDNGDSTFGLFVKPITNAAGEPASYTFSTAGSGSSRCILLIGRITGADLTAPVDAAGAVSTYIGTTSIDLPSVTAATAGCLLLSVCFGNIGGTTAPGFAPAAGMTEVAEESVSPSSSSTLQVSQQLLASAGATGTRTLTISPSANDSGGFLVTIKAGITDKTVNLGQAAATDTAGAITPNRLIPIGQAAETDTADLIFPGQIIPVGQAVETDAATRLAVPLGRATETGAAQPITPNRLVPVGAADINGNPYFVTGVDGWSGQGAALARDTAVVHPDAEASMKITPDGVTNAGGAIADLSAVGSVAAGESYAASMWANSPGGWADVRVAVDWYDAAGAVISTSFGTQYALAAGAWTLVTDTFTAPASASRARMRARHGGTPPGSAVWYVWAVRLTEAAVVETDTATAFTITKTRTIGQAVESDAGRAVAPRVALAPETLLNGVPTPLGVRIYNNFTPALDMWVTKAVDDFSFRSAIPGGFASATITLHRPSIAASPGSGYLFNADKEQFDQLARLFNRVQIVDMRSAEIVWEGRIEGPRRSSDSDTWELSCLGAAVVATDIQRPMFYIDSSIESWLQTPENFWQFSSDEQTKVIEVRWEGNLIWPGPAGTGYAQFKALTWQRTEECDLHIGRYDITFASSAPAGSGNQGPERLWNSVVVYGTLIQGQDGLFDATNYTENIRHMRRVNDAFSSFGTTGGWQMDDAYKLDILMGVGNNATFGNYTSAPDKVVGRIANPRVQVRRQDRTGTPLTDPADYPNEYVTLPEIIEDVVGRFLVAGWHEGSSGPDIPWPGQVRPIDLYLDTSSPAVFTHLTYFDGVTAEQILADMMNAQPEAYWAIWESRYGATDGRGGRDEAGFRFEWATWPNSWGYQASSLDGLEEQPNGEDLYNYIYFKYSLASDWNGTPGHKEIGIGYSQASAGSTTWPPGGFFEGSDLSWGRVSRAITVTNDEPLETGTSSPKVKSLMSRYRRTGNAGTITIRRPIHYYDPGATSYSGASRMVQPWEIRPGKLIKITDMMPRGRIDDHSHGQTAPPEAHDGTVWRVVATEYSSSDNSCRLELDQPTAWSLPTQIVKAGKTAGPTVVKG